MEIELDYFQKLLIGVVFIRCHLLLSHRLLKRVDHPVIVFLLVQICYLARIQHIIYVLEEGLVHDLGVAQQERRFLVFTPSLQHPLSECFPEIGWLKILSKLQLETLLLKHKGGQSCQTLFTRPRDANKHGVTLRMREDSRDCTHVVDCIREENKIHVGGRAELVINNFISQNTY